MNNPSKNKKIVAVVLVRMGSERLSGKVMREIEGKPVLGYILDRLSQCRRLDQVIVATSIHSENDVIQSYCESRDIACFRGDETDVLGRLLGALQAVGATVGVNVFGDQPLVDPKIVDSLVQTYQENKDLFDFVGNNLTITTFPPGTEAEVFPVHILEDANTRATDPTVREHSTLYIRQNPHRYRLHNVVAPTALHRPDIEIELDVMADLMVVEHVLKHFANRPTFSTLEVIQFLDANPELKEKNRDVPRRWKVYRTESEF